MQTVAILSQVCELLVAGQSVDAAELLRSDYPTRGEQSPRRSWPASRAMRVFVRDKFTDRYSGAPLVFPGTLRAISLLLPNEFPYHRNWRQSQTHPAFWELYPTIDHLIPLARGGSDAEDNVVTTSMVRNSAKGNWLLSELQWAEQLAPPREGWDGLLQWFLIAFERFPTLREDRSLKAWRKVASGAT